MPAGQLWTGGLGQYVQGPRPIQKRFPHASTVSPSNGARVFVAVSVKGPLSAGRRPSCLFEQLRGGCQWLRAGWWEGRGFLPVHVRRVARWAAALGGHAVDDWAEEVVVVARVL